MEGHEWLLTTTEVAALFRVDSKSVLRWRSIGRFTRISTPGGQPRYLESEVRALLDASPDGRPGVPSPPPRPGPVPEQE